MDQRITRRSFLAGAAAGAAAGPFIVLTPGFTQTGPVKLGIVEPQSGPVKYVGDNNIAAYRSRRSGSTRPAASWGGRWRWWWLTAS